MIRPYPYQKLPRVSRVEVDVVETLHRARYLWDALNRTLKEAVGCELVSEIIHMGVNRSPVVGAELGAGWFCSLVDGCMADVGWIHLDAPLAQALAAVVLSGELPRQIELRPLVPIEAECLSVLAAHLMARIGAPFQVQQRQNASINSEQTHLLGRVRSRLTIGSLSGLSTFWIDPDSWSFAVQLAQSHGFDRAKILKASNLSKTYHQKVSVRLAQFKQQARYLRSLEVGDVLLPKSWMNSELPSRGVLMFGRHPLVRVALGWQKTVTIRLSDGIGLEAQDMDDFSDKTDETYLVDTVEELAPTQETRPTVLDLVVGRLDMSLSDVLELQPGRIVTIAQRVDEPIDLVFEGRIIGQGELVEVEGRLGVRIVSVSPPLSIGVDVTR